MDKIEVNRDCLLTESSGRQWHFFCSDRNGICFKTKDKNGTNWKSYEIILKEGVGDFDAHIDEVDNIHLICQDKAGSVTYLMYSADKWHKYVILKSKGNSLYPKHFSILLINNRVNLFYLVKNNRGYMLTHQVLDSSNRHPQILNYVDFSEKPFSAMLDSSNNIHLFYSSQGVFGTQMYQWSKKTWEEFKVIDKQQQIMYPSGLADSDDNTHITGRKKDGDIYNIIYRKRGFTSFKNTAWSEEMVVVDNCGDVTPVLFNIEDKLFIMWSYDLKVYSIYSSDGGEHWSEERQLPGGRYGNIRLFGYRNMSNKKVSVDRSYGYDTNKDVSLYIISDYIKSSTLSGSDYHGNQHRGIERASAGAEQSPPPDRGGYQSDYQYRTPGNKDDMKLKMLVNMLGDTVEKHSNAIKSIGKRIQVLEESIVSISSQSDRLSVKLDNLEKEINGMKSDIINGYTPVLKQEQNTAAQATVTHSQPEDNSKSAEDVHRQEDLQGHDEVANDLCESQKL